MKIQKQQINLQEEDITEFREYLYERENASATVQKYTTDIRTFFMFLQGENNIDKRRVLEYKEWLQENYEASSVNSMLVALNQFLEFMGAGSLKVKRLKIQKQLFLSDEKEMTKEEYERLIETARSQKRSQLALGMETLASTGARISELSYFTVEKVRRGSIEITNKGKRRTIILTDDLRKKLLYFATKHGIEKGSIFVTKNGKPKDRSNFWREMKALKKEAGVAEEKIFPHNLRHLFARLFYKKTKDLTGLADLLGHSSLNVTRIYTASPGERYKKQIRELGLVLKEKEQ